MNTLMKNSNIKFFKVTLMKKENKQTENAPFQTFSVHSFTPVSQLSTKAF
jgi:hypothetical protein